MRLLRQRTGIISVAGNLSTTFGKIHRFWLYYTILKLLCINRFAPRRFKLRCLQAFKDRRLGLRPIGMLHY